MLLPLIAAWTVAAVPQVSTTTTATVVDTPDITFVSPDTPPLGPGELFVNEPEEAPEPEAEPGAPRIEVEAPPPAPPPAKPQPKMRKLEGDERISYGIGNVALGLLGLGVAVGGGFSESALLIYAGITTYLLGPTAVHWAYGNFEEGLASIALNAGTPLVGSLGLLIVGLPIAGDSDSGGIAIAGLLLGAAAALLIDGLVLAYVDEVEIVPSVDISSDRTSFLIGGRF
ncbi:MAG: hypothetical protein RMA76_29605 [Deltaproteobacteria bacterium]|jgi:hypothetical protein